MRIDRTKNLFLTLLSVAMAACASPPAEEGSEATTQPLNNQAPAEPDCCRGGGNYCCCTSPAYCVHSAKTCWCEDPYATRFSGGFYAR